MSSCQEIDEEFDALTAIFEEQFSELGRVPYSCMIKVDCEDPLPTFFMRFNLPLDYPEALPELIVLNRNNVFGAEFVQHLTSHLISEAETQIGSPMIYTLVEAAKEWVTKHWSFVEAPGEPMTEDVANDDVELTPVDISDIAQKGGRLNIVLGLVGKPSAGKSTFFNAATQSDMARIGAFPFTTIEPNMDVALVPVPCPCAELMDRTCDAEFGHTIDGSRLHPVKVKDVAGLVPGAYEGKGRGNQFLNDLCDADVLVHVIDASGCTDATGTATQGYDPVKDVDWVWQEIVHWVLDNVLNKWQSVMRRPLRLPELFSGYRAQRSLVLAALAKVGVDGSQLQTADTSEWDEVFAGRLVREFVRLRFPIVLALNKAEVESSAENIDRIGCEFAHLSQVRMSARCETWLHQMNASGVIKYSPGADKFTIVTQPNEEQQKQCLAVKSYMINAGSTGVQQVLAEAYKLCHAIPVFPVRSLESLTATSCQSDITGVLSTCVQMRLKSRVADVYHALLYAPTEILKGEFVRAECLDRSKEKPIKRPARKEEEIRSTNNILHIMTNKRKNLT